MYCLPWLRASLPLSAPLVKADGLRSCDRHAHTTARMARHTHVMLHTKAVHSAPILCSVGTRSRFITRGGSHASGRAAQAHTAPAAAAAAAIAAATLAAIAAAIIAAAAPPLQPPPPPLPPPATPQQSSGEGGRRAARGSLPRGPLDLAEDTRTARGGWRARPLAGAVAPPTVDEQLLRGGVGMARRLLE